MTEAEALTWKIVEIFDTGAFALIPSLIAPEYVDHQGLDEQEIRGPDGFRAVVEAARRDDGVHVTVEDLVADEEKAAVRLCWSGVNQAGVVVMRETLDMLCFADGRLVEHWSSLLFRQEQERPHGRGRAMRVHSETDRLRWCMVWASITLRGDRIRHEMPPKAAPAEGRPKARPLHSPEGRPDLLQVVADYKRLSAVQGAGRAGHGRASGPQYFGVAEGIGRAGVPIRPGGLILSRKCPRAGTTSRWLVMPPGWVRG